MSKEVEAHVRGICETILDAAFERQAVVPNADAVLHDDEVLLIDDVHELTELVHGSTQARWASIPTSSS